MISVQSLPVYDHDCLKCRFLGTTGPTRAWQKTNATDHYRCGDTLIQRRSSDGPDYSALPVQYCTGDDWAATRALVG